MLVLANTQQIWIGGTKAQEAVTNLHVSLKITSTPDSIWLTTIFMGRQSP